MFAGAATVCEAHSTPAENKKTDFVIANWSNAHEDGTPWEKPVFDKERFKEAQNYLIQSQMKPHFIFNTLNISI